MRVSRKRLRAGGPEEDREMSTDEGTGSDAGENESEIIEVLLDVMQHPDQWARLKNNRKFREVVAYLFGDAAINNCTRQRRGRLPWGPLIFPDNKDD
jgi:hypothetical protein